MKNKFSQLIKELKGNRTLKQFSGDTGVSAPTLRKYMKADSAVSTETACRIILGDKNPQIKSDLSEKIRELAPDAEDALVNTAKKSSASEPELLIVEDRRELNAAERSGKMTPEEKQAIFGGLARSGKLMNTEDGKRYLEMFGMPKFFLGASDGPVIAGHSRWKSPLYLQYEKLGMVTETITPSKAWIFRYGNMAEDLVASIGTVMLREQEVMDARYEDCEFGYICTSHPHVLVHPDGFLLDRTTGKLICLAEVKTAAAESPHWAEFAVNIVPQDYQDQCQIMMYVLSAGGMDITECYVLASNKTGEEDGFVQVPVVYDEAYAVSLLDKMEQFYEDTVSGLFYEDCELLPEEAAALYKEEDKSLGYIELPKSKYEKLIQDLEALTEEENLLKEELAEPLKDLEEIRKQKKLLKSRLYTAIGKAPGGTILTGSKKYSFKVRRSYSLDKDVKEWAEMNEDESIRAAWAKIKEVKPLISMTCTTVDAEGNRAVFVEI